jgi:hypothetical protein
LLIRIIRPVPAVCHKAHGLLSGDRAGDFAGSAPCHGCGQSQKEGRISIAEIERDSPIARRESASVIDTIVQYLHTLSNVSISVSVLSGKMGR